MPRKRKVVVTFSDREPKDQVRFDYVKHAIDHAIKQNFLFERRFKISVDDQFVMQYYGTGAIFAMSKEGKYLRSVFKKMRT